MEKRIQNIIREMTKYIFLDLYNLINVNLCFFKDRAHLYKLSLYFVAMLNVYFCSLYTYYSGWM